MTDRKLQALFGSVLGARHAPQKPPIVVTLSIEAIGDDLHQLFRRFGPDLAGTHISPERKIRLLLEYHQRRGHRPWVARITGLLRDGTLERRFLDGRKDYSQANSVGSRGIYYHYHLPPGLYEVNHPEIWKRCRRYFARVAGGVLSEIPEEEVRRCLA